MKKLFLSFASLVMLQSTLLAQSKTETAIRKLEQLEIQSIEKGYIPTLLKLWGDKYFYSSYGVIVTVPQILGFIRAGEIDYASTVRIVEKVTFIQNIAISMGREIVKPQNNTPNVGKTITLRFTHTWIKNKGGWEMAARQATKFLVE